MTKIRDHHSIIFWTGFAVVVALLGVAPLVLPEFWRRFLTEILIWGLLAMSSDVLIGYTGMISFGHSAFFGLGMYGAAAALILFSPPNLWLAIAFGLVASAAVALFVAYFSIRLRDIYFAITTLIFSQIFYVLIFTWTEVTGGENGLNFTRPRLSLFGLFPVRFTTTTMHWFVLGVVVLSYLLLRRVMHSPFGMVLQSIRENEARTRAIGYAVQRYKMVSVMLSACSPASLACSTRCRRNSRRRISSISSCRARPSSTTSWAASARWSGRSSAPPSSSCCARPSRASSPSITSFRSASSSSPW